MNTLQTSLVVGACLFGLACGGAAVPTEKLTAAESSMRAAEEVGAKSVPKAELHLKLAEEQVAQARKLSEDGENERAARLLSRARADAELAVALAKDAEAKNKLEAADAHLKTVTQEDASNPLAGPEPAPQTGSAPEATTQNQTVSSAP